MSIELCSAQAHVDDESYLVCNREAGHEGQHFDEEMQIIWEVSDAG